LARVFGRTLGRIATFTILLLLIVLAAGITLTVGWRPVLGPKTRPLTSRKFEATPERMQRGKYLVEGVVGCVECHSTHDESKHEPVLKGDIGAGSIFINEGKFRVVAPNITPDPDTGIGKWSDDAIARAIREGVAQDGHTLFPIMPYGAFRNLSDDDVAAIVVYVRSLQPVKSQLPRTSVPFPISRLINTVPQPVTAPVPDPDLSTPEKRGAYLIKVAVCEECHTPQNHPPKSGMIPDMYLAGGNMFDAVASANITPDDSGIKHYDEALFLQAMRTGYVRAREIKPPMPWSVYRHMNDDDLKGLFAYLRTVKPVHHSVDNNEPPTQCRLCGNKHGLGDKN